MVFSNLSSTRYPSSAYLEHPPNQSPLPPEREPILVVFKA
ncbi:hypothetical protein PS655_00057 [Pseudomonas fluorescens]|uniref:Uncharacterized protein n=1 Tax=Pseudomonas fluorescens TaxID=294 RepID=A0A5E6P1X2_PSEFL|nr:hypothetical protein PS655_00057 [Pseudomonas fluorescens]